MSNINEIDKILKERLGSYEEAPPAHLWDKIATGIANVPAETAFYQSMGFKITAVAAAIALIVGLGWLLNPMNEDQTDTNIIITTNIESKQNRTETTHIQTNNEFNQESNTESTPLEANVSEGLSTSSSKQQLANNITANHKAETESSNTEAIIKSQNSAILQKTNFSNQKVADQNANAERIELTQRIPITESQIEEESIIAEAEVISENNVSSEVAVSQEEQLQNSTESQEVVNQTEVKEANTEINEPIETETVIEKTEQLVIEDELAINHLAEKPKADFSPETRSFNKYGIGAHYGMEFIQVNDLSIKANNIDLSFNYQNLNFIFQTGIGFQYSQDKGNYQVDYVRNDYSETEQRFDSINFVLDSNGTVTPVPINPYYVDIYDSIDHKYNASIYQSYYSIRIPILVGYQKDFKKFGIFAKGGIFYSLVVHKASSNMYQVDQSSTLTSISYEEYTRKTSQIEYALSGGLSYRFNKQFHFHAEVMGKFYQHSVYENSAYANTNPWSIEGRLGLIYFLN